MHEDVFLSGGGEMGALMRAHDWSGTPLGAPERWPQALKAMVGAVLNSPMLGTVLWGPELLMLYNDAYIPSLADRHPAALGRSVAEVWGAAWEQVAPPFLRVLETGEGFSQSEVELPMVRRGRAETTYWNLSATPIRGEDGAIAGLLNQGVEITEQIVATRRLQTDRSRLSAMFEQAPSFMAVLGGPDHVLELVNPGYQRLIGAREVLGRTVADALPDAVKQGYLELLDRVYATGEAFAATASKYDVQVHEGDEVQERYVDFVYQPLKDDAGVVTGVFVEGVDVTDRARGESARQASEDRYRQIVEGALDFAIVTLDEHGVIDGWNAGACALIGFTEAETLGRPGALIFTPEDTADGVPDHEMSRASADGRALDERWHLRKDGTRFWGSGLLMQRAGGGFVKMFRDRTAEHEAERQVRELNQTLEQQVRERTEALRTSEEALRQSQKLDAMGQLTGGVAHDFNNLLTIIRSSIDYLKRDDLPPARRERYVGAISDTVDRAAKLTSQLLSFARRQPLKPETFDVGERVRNVAELIRPLTGVRVAIAVETCPTACFAVADVSQFETALVNLAVNARDAMDGEGCLRFAIQEVSDVPAIRGHTRAAGEFVAVTVTDTGAGIAPDQLASIFEPFYTTKEVGKGTGLGLSQVFGFAKQAGGEVDVRSTRGEGATFTLYLPRVTAPEETGGPETGEEPIQARPGLRVLVVEDNEAVGAFATEMLTDLGNLPTWVGNASAALTRLAEDVSSFDVVFSDVVMPGTNGVDLARAIQRLHPGLPVVLTSGYSDVLTQEGRHGFELLQKPYSVDELSGVLRKVATSAV